ncbi:DNA phosphorothioation-dependent restriction protein DptG [Bacillus sp. F19]|nr:DNA phosphorothioation-dependent restriction protein DptG [Bacillus sp. F19]
MDYNQNLIELRRYLGVKPDKKGLTHNINKHAPYFPFPTRASERARFARGFDGVVGEFTRLVSNHSLKEKIEIEDIIKGISDKVQMDIHDTPYFQRLMKLYLADNHSSMKVFHPHIFQYFQRTEGDEGKGEAEIALLLRDIYIKSNESIRSMFAKGNSDHVISKLILDQLDYLVVKEKANKYVGKLPHITDLFNEDISYLAKYPEYFTVNLSLFLSYYYFFYISQLSLKLSQKFIADSSKVNELFYMLDWEGPGKSRKSYTKGYNLIKDSLRNLLIQVNTLEHVNSLQGTHGLSYPELVDFYNGISVIEQTELSNVLTNWILEYRGLMELEQIKELPEKYDELIISLYNSIEEVHTKLPTKQGTKSRYSLSLEQIGKKYFLKTRGSLGYMLNIKQELLLLITTVVVKDERKSLKSVFEGLEKRGLFFDRYSKEGIVELYDKLNLLDKKSDSGDAQYVKPIL